MTCPELMSKHFRYSDVVDLHNQSRQFDLHLNNKWVTQSGYFKLMVGMSITDTCKIYKSLDQNTITICQYADILAGDMMEYAANFTDDEDA